MTFPRMKQFAEKRGWIIEKNFAYGEENGYLFTLADQPGSKSFFVPLPEINEHGKELIINFFTENKKELKISKTFFDNGVLIIKFIESFKSTKIETMENLICTATSFFQPIAYTQRIYVFFVEKKMLMKRYSLTAFAITLILDVTRMQQ